VLGKTPKLQTQQESWEELPLPSSRRSCRTVGGPCHFVKMVGQLLERALCWMMRLFFELLRSGDGRVQTLLFASFFFTRYRKGEGDFCDILGGSFVQGEGFWRTNFLW